MATNKHKSRTYARNRQSVSRRGRENLYEKDSTYLLKLIVVVLLGTFWLKFSSPLMIGNFPLAAIPIGAVVGLFLVGKFEHFQFDRKIWYAVLILVTVISYFVPAGIVL